MEQVKEEIIRAIIEMEYSDFLEGCEEMTRAVKQFPRFQDGSGGGSDSVVLGLRRDALVVFSKMRGITYKAPGHNHVEGSEIPFTTMAQMVVDVKDRWIHIVREGRDFDGGYRYRLPPRSERFLAKFQKYYLEARRSATEQRIKDLELALEMEKSKLVERTVQPGAESGD